MSKRQLIDEIRSFNRTALPEFLARFNEVDLNDYLEHLLRSRKPRLNGDSSRYARYFKSDRPAQAVAVAQPIAVPAVIAVPVVAPAAPAAVPAIAAMLPQADEPVAPASQPATTAAPANLPQWRETPANQPSADQPDQAPVQYDSVYTSDQPHDEEFDEDGLDQPSSFTAAGDESSETPGEVVGELAPTASQEPAKADSWLF